MEQPPVKKAYVAWCPDVPMVCGCTSLEEAEKKAYDHLMGLIGQNNGKEVHIQIGVVVREMIGPTDPETFIEELIED